MQDFRCEALFFAQQTQEQMLRPNVFMIQAFGLFSAVSENPFTLMAQGQVDRSGYLLPDRSVAFNLLSDGINGGMRPEKPVRELFVFPQQSEKKVLCLDVRATELAGFVPC